LGNVARIAIIHTNDVHAQLDLWPHTASVIRTQLARAEADGRTAIYVDAGDFLEMSDRTCYGSRGRIAPPLLGLVGCRALSLGNNEIWRAPLSVLAGLASSSAFPWLCANLRDASGNPIPGVRDWAVLDVGPVKLGLFGLTPIWPGLAEPMGVIMFDQTEQARRCVAELRAAGADVVMLLSHAGIREDREFAATVPGLDIIIGGHSHTEMTEPETVNGIPVAHAGSRGRYVGALYLDVDTAAHKVLAWSGRVTAVEPTTVPPDAETVTVIASLKAEADTALNEVLTVLDQPLTHEITGPSRLGPVMAEALRRHAGGELGLMIGAQALNGFPAGALTRGHVLESLQAMFIPALVELSGRALHAVLEESEDPAVYTKASGAGGQRPYGTPLGRVFTSNVSYEADGGAPAGARISNLRVGGEPVEPDRIYRAGAASLFAIPEAGYASFAGVKLVRRFMPEMVREVVEAHLRNGFPSA